MTWIPSTWNKTGKYGLRELPEYLKTLNTNKFECIGLVMPPDWTTSLDIVDEDKKEAA